MEARSVGRILLALVAAFALWPAGAFGGMALCPPVPPAGSKVKGGLEVDGACVVKNVTVNGGIVVDPTGRLELENVTVDGGLVLDGGELDVGAVLGVGTPTGIPSTIRGGITINGAIDFDIHGAQIDGGVTMTGQIGAQPGLCGNDIRGAVSLANVTGTFQILIGEPEANEGLNCPGNMIHGTLSVSNSRAPFGVELEGNAVTGSVLINGGFVEVGHNNIGGSLLCSPGTVLRISADSGGDTVRGANTCE